MRDNLKGNALSATQNIGALLLLATLQYFSSSKTTRRDGSRSIFLFSILVRMSNFRSTPLSLLRPASHSYSVYKNYSQSLQLCKNCYSLCN